jgi:hypothetical protein
MSTPTWDPAGNAFHRLIQLIDVLALAMNRARRLSAHFPEPDESGDDRLLKSLWDQYLSVYQSIFPPEDIHSRHTAFRLANDARIELLKSGSTDEHAICAAHKWLENAGLLPVPWPAPREGEEPCAWYEHDSKVLEEYYSVRHGLITTLTRLRQTIPDYVLRREDYVSHPWPIGSNPFTVGDLYCLIQKATPLAEKPSDSSAGQAGNRKGGLVKSHPETLSALLIAAQKDLGLKGQERAVVEHLCNAGGELPISDLAHMEGVDWSDPIQGFKNLQRRLLPKLKPFGWELRRQNNTARLHRKGAKEGSKSTQFAPF